MGKTSILMQYTQDTFDSKTKNTIGVDLKVRMVDFMGKRLKLTLWDTAGQERFRTLTASYYRGANGVVLVYDVTNRASFEHVKDWLEEVNVYCTNERVVRMLVGNKIDREDDRKVTKVEAMDFARSHGMLFIECSAKTKEGVNQAFQELIQKTLEVQDGSGKGGGAGAAGAGDRISLGAAAADNEDEPGLCC